MRLFIAGILTLVIYLLTPDTTDMPASVYHSQPQPDVPVIYHPLHPSDFFFTTFLQERHLYHKISRPPEFSRRECITLRKFIVN